MKRIYKEKTVDLMVEIGNMFSFAVFNFNTDEDRERLSALASDFNFRIEYYEESKGKENYSGERINHIYMTYHGRSLFSDAMYFGRNLERSNIK